MEIGGLYVRPTNAILLGLPTKIEVNARERKKLFRCTICCFAAVQSQQQWADYCIHLTMIQWLWEERDYLHGENADEDEDETKMN